MSDTPPTTRLPFVDGHNDTVLRVTDDDRPGDSFVTGEPDATRDETRADGSSSKTHLDLPRAQAAGMAAGFFAMFVLNTEDPNTEAVDLESDTLPPAIDPGIARRVVHDQFATLHHWAESADAVRLVGDLDDLDACLAGHGTHVDSPENRPLGIIPHIEGAAAVRPDCSNLAFLHAAGLRSLGIVWSRPNQFGEGVPFVHDATPDRGNGLTEAGKDLVRECNTHGIVVDCAHLTGPGVWDVLETTTAPPVVSHTAAHAICPATRNLTDDMLAAIGDRDGLVGLTFSTAHLHPDGDREATVPLSLVADHVDHIAEVAGIDSVALGSDFDGATIAESIRDVRGVQALFAELRDWGYTQAELEAISHGNWRRVCAETWE